MLTRILTAAVLAPLVIWLLMAAPSSYLAPVFVLCVAVSSWEVTALLRRRPLENNYPSESLLPLLNPWLRALKKLPYLIQSVTVACAVLGFAALNFLAPNLGLPCFALLMIFYLILLMLVADHVDEAMHQCLFGCFALAYSIFPWVALWRLHDLGHNAAYVLFTLCVVFLGDTGGYFGGRLFGRNKLAPSLSPNKTVEGSISGLLLSALTAYSLNQWYDGLFGNDILLFMATVLGAAIAQLGDLFESGLKRFCGSKDSGGIFPGHGGLLDRVDGLLFAAPWFWAYFYFT